MESEKRKLLEKVLRESRKLIMEYDLKEKHIIVKLMKTLLSGGVDPDKLKPITDFYKNYEETDFDLENSAIFKEYKQKLIDLADAEGIVLPEDLR